MGKSVKQMFKFTSIVTYRVPQYKDGTFGNPQILNKFTTQPKKDKKKTSRKKKKFKAKNKPKEEYL